MKYIALDCVSVFTNKQNYFVCIQQQAKSKVTGSTRGKKTKEKQ